MGAEAKGFPTPLKGKSLTQLGFDFLGWEEEIRAATNLASNIIATLVVARWTNSVDHARAMRLLDGGADDQTDALARSAVAGAP